MLHKNKTKTDVIAAHLQQQEGNHIITWIVIV